MRKISVIFLYFIIFVFSIFIFALVWGYIKVSMEYLHRTFIYYTIVSFVIATVFIRIILFLESRKPKTEVKIVYKTIDPEKEKENKKQQEKKRLKQIIQNALQQLDNKKDIVEFSDQLFENLNKSLKIVQGMLFVWDAQKQVYKTTNLYAYYSEDTYREYKLGEGITGQVAKNKKLLYINNVPEGYITVLSGLGKGTPRYLTFLPIVEGEHTIAIIEFATFEALPEPTEEILNNISQKLLPYFKKYIKFASADEKK